MTYQEKLGKITFLIPIFNLKDERLENFKFILPKIKEITDNILVVEQVKNKKDRSEAYNFIKSLGIEYLPVKVNDDHIHKSKIINIGTDKIKTEFVWVNDSDCYLKFKKVIEQLDFRHDFIQPYNIAKYIEKYETDKIINNEPVDIEFDYSRLHETGQHVVPGTLYYVAMYGALSFIYRKYAFKKIGAMNEQYSGWGLEDNSLCMRMFNSDPTFDIINQAGIHLYHPRGNYKQKLESDRTLNNIKVYEEEFGGVLYTDLHKRLRDYYKLILDKKILIIGIERSGTNLLINSICNLAKLTYYSEPFGIYGLYARKYINYKDFNLDSYLNFFTNKPSCCIKHIDSTKLYHPAYFNISKENYREKVNEKLIESFTKIIITTRINAIDWMVSFALAFREDNWINKEYQSSFKLDKKDFDFYYKIWHDYHYQRLPDFINTLISSNKKYRVIDYDDLRTKDGNFFDLDLDITYKDILTNANIVKQKTKNNYHYISNYDEVLRWFANKSSI